MRSNLADSSRAKNKRSYEIGFSGLSVDYSIRLRVIFTIYPSPLLAADDDNGQCNGAYCQKNVCSDSSFEIQILMVVNS